MKKKKPRRQKLKSLAFFELRSVVHDFASVFLDRKVTRKDVESICFPESLCNLCSHFNTDPWKLLEEFLTAGKH